MRLIRILFPILILWPALARGQGVPVDSACHLVYPHGAAVQRSCAVVAAAAAPAPSPVVVAPAPTPAPAPASSGVTLAPFKRDSFAVAGYSVIADRDLATVRPCTADSIYTCAARLAGWEDHGVRDTVVSDRPGGAGHVGVFRFPSGSYGGIAPGTMSKSYGVTRHRRAYVAMLVKLDAHWYGNLDVNKQGYLWPGGKPGTMQMLIGSGTGALAYRVYLQNLQNADGSAAVHAGDVYQTGSTAPKTDTALNLLNNLAPCIYTRGTWAWLELASDAGTAGARNGVVDWWLNGTHCGHAEGLPLVASNQSATWGEYQDDPIYGGQATVIPTVQYRWTARLLWLGRN